MRRINTAVIVAAGSGNRFGGSQPKQFVNLLGKPLIIHTLERFEACPEIDEIVLVLTEDGRIVFEQINGHVDFSKLKLIVTGGNTRGESVKNALDAIDADQDDIIAVHDGARPLVSVEDISRTIIKAAATGAACLVADITDTIKEIKGDFISRTIDRRHLRRALTPQAFRYDILMKAFDGADLSDSITDECYLVEKLGVKISLVESSGRNIKITRPEDIVLAEALLDQT